MRFRHQRIEATSSIDADLRMSDPPGEVVFRVGEAESDRSQAHGFAEWNIRWIAGDAA